MIVAVGHSSSATCPRSHCLSSLLPSSLLPPCPLPYCGHKLWPCSCWSAPRERAFGERDLSWHINASLKLLISASTSSSLSPLPTRPLLSCWENCEGGGQLAEQGDLGSILILTTHFTPKKDITHSRTNRAPSK